MSQTDQDRQVFSKLPVWRKRTLFVCSCALSFLLQFDMAAVAVTWTKIAEDKKAPSVKIFALSTGYLLAQTVFQLVFSHISHAVGRKFMYITGLLLFLAGAIAAATRPPMDALIGARVVQGIGAAGMFTMSAIVIVEMTQPRQRAGWTSLSQAFGALGNICGPLVAGSLCNHFGFPWSYIFFFEVGIAVFLLSALVLLLPGENRSRKDRLRELKGCDWYGILLFFVCSVTLLVPINIGGTTEGLGWESAPVITCFVVGLYSLAVLVYHQRCLASRPAFPREIFARPATNVAFLGNAVCGVLISMVFYHLVLFWDGVRRKSMVEVGKMLLSVTLTYPVAFAITGIAIRRWGRLKYATAAGAMLVTLGLGLMQIMTERASQAGLLVICVCAGAGCGIFMPAMVNAVIATTDSRWHPHAIAIRTLLYTGGQCVGVSLGLAIFTTAFRNRFDAQEGDAATRAAVAKAVLINPQELISKLEILWSLAPGGELVRMVVGALRAVWVVACVLAGVTGALAILMRLPDLAKDSTTERVLPDEERQEKNTEMTSRR
ncbi:hypothetical protein INS49_002467 [Diaporthe citri]|uniref:uncharacterized protein n=1 Tax=Diaporthe citri TaxID=83186 RepID=UPI001C7FFC93|nr:uncharacterized protein INS49_002467 [Diaporthe citri]KAG6368265.1 hypothetical protein INS49_002467 [Diaporthe citri]